MTTRDAVDPKLARQLVLDELFDLSLYRSLRDVATGDTRAILEQLIPIESRHYAFWQDFFDLHIDRLDWARRLRLAVIVAVCRVLGAPAIHLVLEAIEVYGVRKYLRVWRAYGDGPLGAAVRDVLGAKSVLLSALAAGSLIVLVSMILAFLSGMDIRRRVVTNLVVIAVAVGVSFAIGFVANRLWGLYV